MMRRLVLAIAAAVTLCAPAFAADVKTVDMGRGTQIWFVEDHTIPLIAITVALPAGSAYDAPGKEGTAALAAGLLDEGAGQYNSFAFQSAMSGRAIRMSASPDRDWLIIQMVTLKENAKDAFRLLGTALSKPHFDPDAISRVRGQIISDLAQNEEDPSEVAGKAFYARFFAGHPYAHSVNGTAASVSAITRDDLRAFARDHWVRGGIHISVSGDVDQATLKTLIASAFSALPVRMPQPIVPVRRMGAPGVQVVPMPIPQPNIVFGLPGLSRKDPDFIPAYVANYILGGGGFSSRLTNEVRVKRGLTYDISTSLQTFTRAGFFAGQVATKAGSVNETTAVIRSTLSNFAANGPTQKELDDAKTYLTGSFPLAFTSNFGITGQLSTFQTVGLPVDYVKNRNALISAVTADDVRRAAKRIFDANRLTIIVAGTPDAAAKPPIRPQPGADKPPQPPQLPAKQPTPPATKPPVPKATTAAPKTAGGLPKPGTKHR